MDNKYLKYSSMAFELMAAIGLGVLLGMFIDKKAHTDKPYFTAFFALVGVCLGLYRTLKDVFKKGE